MLVAKAMLHVTPPLVPELAMVAKAVAVAPTWTERLAGSTAAAIEEVDVKLSRLAEP